MRIAFFMGGLTGNGGIGRVVSIITDRLCNENEIVLITYHAYTKESSLYHINERIKIISLNKSYSMKKFLLTGGISETKRIINENHIDILIACGALFFPITVFSCAGTSAKSICWEHSNANNSADHSFQMMSRYIGAKKSDAVVVLTKQDFDLYRNKYNPKRLYQIYNPIDDRIKYNYIADSDDKHIISVGRLTYQKNYPLLIRVAERVLKENPDWTWDIYGEGEDREAIEEQIRQKDLTDKLSLKGQVDDLYERYKDYSFYVLTSRYEGFGMALVEANRTGLPIISFDVECGPREIINNGYNGYLIEPFDENAMYERINELCKNEKERRKLSENIKNSDNPFKISEIIEKWETLFDMLEEMK